MIYLSGLLVVNLLHLSTAVDLDLFSCIRNLSDPPSPPLTFSGGEPVCEHFTSAFGPSIGYCSDGYSFTHSMGIRGEDDQEVYSILPAGEIVDLNTAERPYVEIKHSFTVDDTCVFDNEEVDSIYIKYKHVDAAGHEIGDMLSGSDSNLLGTLKHGASVCANPPYRPITHTSLSVELYAGYPDNTKSHPISPTFLFEMNQQSEELSITHNNWNDMILWEDSQYPGLPYFLVGENAAIDIMGPKCITNYDVFQLVCEDSISGDGIEGRWEHTIRMSERENIQTSYNEELFETSVHFKPHSYGYGSSEWSTTLFIPSDVTEIMWEGALNSCSIECFLNVYDVEGNSMGSFDFLAASDGCPDGPVLEPNPGGPPATTTEPPATTTEPPATTTVPPTTTAAPLPQEWLQVGHTLEGYTAGIRFGYSVAFNGNRLVVGAPFADRSMTNNGIAQVFDLQTDGSFTQIGTDIEGESVNDLSGSAVAMSENGMRVAVSASNTGSEDNFEEVMVYELQGGDWVRIGQIIQDLFHETGDSLALSHDGSILAVGSPYFLSLRGKVEVYRYDVDDNHWHQIGQDIIGEDTFDRLGGGAYAEEATGGHSVALSGDGLTLAVGAQDSDGFEEGKFRSGHVWIFSYNDVSDTWDEIGMIFGDDVGDWSGSAVALSTDGRTVAIGSPGHNDPAGDFDHGQVRIFEYVGSAWIEVFEVLGNEGEQCGRALTLSGDASLLAISCPGVQAWRGAVRVYENDGTEWSLVGEEIVGYNDFDHFGSALDFDIGGDRLAIGAQGGDYVEIFEYGVASQQS